eukprot:scaffold906_cov18-Tisochrysis_lutea.AAC.1
MGFGTIPKMAFALCKKRLFCICLAKESMHAWEWVAMSTKSRRTFLEEQHELCRAHDCRAECGHKHRA